MPCARRGQRQTARDGVVGVRASRTSVTCLLGRRRGVSPVVTWHMSCGLVQTGGGLRADVKRLARYARRCPRLFLAAMAASRPSPPRRLASDLGNA